MNRTDDCVSRSQLRNHCTTPAPTIYILFYDVIPKRALLLFSKEYIII